MFRGLFAWIKKYERHLSAIAMVAGFVIDNIFFDRVDLPQTEALFIGYIVIAAGSIALLHFLETRKERGIALPRWSSALPIVTQFMLGGMWSGFLIFYSRSATLATSWPFLLLLILIFLGNEYFSKYHERLVFTTLLFFFGLYSYTIFAVPVFTGSIGVREFLISGAIAAGIFAVFLIALRLIGRTRFLADRWKIRGGALAILIIINLFYFTNVLPPLPLALKSGGVYHSIDRRGATGYEGTIENQPWRVSLGFTPVEHIQSGDELSVFSAIFAPVKLATTVVHHWEFYDPSQKKWVTEARITFPIAGGRDGGYRGYSTKSALMAGAWRVDIETPDGKTIGRVRFDIAFTDTEPNVIPTSL